LNSQAFDDVPVAATGGGYSGGFMRLALLLLLAAAPLQAQDAPTFTRQVSDGVYTVEQASRGQALYGTYCAKCHGPELQGRADFPVPSTPPPNVNARWRIGTPALKGASFIANWVDLPLAQLFERTRISMPQDSPGRLSRRQNADIVAFILQQNGYQAGAEDMAELEASLSTIRMGR
jgi:mono/diheme cytochrome c family protein